MNNVIDLFLQNKRAKEIIDCPMDSILVSGATINHNILLAASKFRETNETVIYVSYNLYKATYVYEKLCDIIGVDNVNFFVTDEIVAVEALAISNEFKYERMHTIKSLIKGEKKIIVTYISSFLRPLISKDIYKNNIIHIKQNDTIDVKEIIKKLVIMGYIRTAATSQTGEFSVRGEVIDVFPINNDKPYRIDLFDDEVEVIKVFDPKTQMSSKKINDIEIFPINELIYEYSDEIVDRIKKDIKDDDLPLFEDDFRDLKEYSNNDRLYKYIKYIYKDTYNITDFIDKGTLIIDNYNYIFENYKKTIEELNFFLENKKEYHKLNLAFFDDFQELNINNLQKLYCMEMTQYIDAKIKMIIDLQGLNILNYQNNVSHFVEDVVTTKKTVLVVCNKDASMHLITDAFKVKNIVINEIDDIKDIKEKEVNICKADNYISYSFIDGIEVITEDNIFKEKKINKSKYRSIYENSTVINSKDDLKPGDYVVHYDYGIGRYQGIKAVEFRGMTNDYLAIDFANNSLYVPIERINLIEKYLGSEGSVPTLSSIGSKEWAKKKAKIQAKVESIAQDLIDVQAKREKMRGFTYEKDDETQEQFEKDFEYELTPDQAKTIKDIKRDMEDGLIIDRLVCGDVGYGKTEVAIRIALKTVLNGKQVAFLAPTTILTRQHYLNFKQRFENYGLRVELLNRLISKKDQVKILEDLKCGKVDIIIGTHSLLGESVKYKDLGLLIVDEEQRFGVTHKEKIKKLKENINVITLTATPIPRTLQMSIMGVRQLSLMETPPQNRYPVQTYVVEQNDYIIREAIYRELGRNGQVFYLHNRVDDLPRIYHKLTELVPEAKIIVAHGQMSKEELEDAIQMFIDKDYNVLLCTTIIETGIDIPNTNTLLVDDADRLGLAQMYQIRGRVGRSNRISYAYFMYNKKKVLTDSATKRLDAIKEFTTLGSGYKIAVRDLAIRGAGDILGKEQSGFIDTIGLDLYMKMLSEAIDKLKGVEKESNANKISYQVNIQKHVSDDYVSDDDIKIYIHKEIKNIDSRERMIEVEYELKDRFGELTKDIKLYIKKQYMESLARKLKVEKIKEETAFVELKFEMEAEIDAGRLFKLAYNVSDRFTFKYADRRIIMTLNEVTTDKEWINKVIKVFEGYLK